MAWDNLEVGIIVIITTRDNHYYDEDNIEVGKYINCQVVVNHTIALTEEEKAEARKKGYRAIPSRGIPQTYRQETKSGEASGTADSTTLTIRVLTL